LVFPISAQPPERTSLYTLALHDALPIYFDDPQLTAKHFQNGSYLTDDYGAVDDVVRVHGRLDDVMNTGGIKVSAAKVQQVLQRWVPEAFVTGIDDGHWGQRVCAAVTGTAAQHILADAVRQELG